MRYLIVLFFTLSLCGDTSFITPMEYASQLYKNPRGIGCNLCHGDDGEGKVIARYTDKDEKKSFKAPPINNIDFEKFYNTLNRRNRGMPRYFLTKPEIKALYFYLQERKIAKNEK